MPQHYAVHEEGNSWAWSTTPSDTPADFEKAKAEAEERSRASGRNWVVRHNDRQVSRVICTATPEGIAWPRLASPPIPVAEVTPEGGHEPVLCRRTGYDLETIDGPGPDCARQADTPELEAQ